MLETTVGSFLIKIACDELAGETTASASAIDNPDHLPPEHEILQMLYEYEGSKAKAVLRIEGTSGSQPRCEVTSIKRANTLRQYIKHGQDIKRRHVWTEMSNMIRSIGA